MAIQSACRKDGPLQTIFFPADYTNRVQARHRALLLFAWLTASTWAQTSLVSGALDGSVSDSSGGRIPGVEVTVRDTATHLTREVSTNAEGSYHIAELPVGIYEVLASSPGFAPAVCAESTTARSRKSATRRGRLKGSRARS